MSATPGVALALATAATIAVAAVPARAQSQRALPSAPAAGGAPSFPTLLRAHVDARVGFDRLPAGAVGAPVREPAVYVSVTSRAVLLYGGALLALDRGRPAAGEVARCASNAPCLPAVRDAVRDARATLARDVEARPRVLLVATGDAAFETLLLVARSVAEAGAAHSMALVLRAGQGLRALPVWTAPGRKITVGDGANPALITSDVRRDRSVLVRATRFYSRGPQRAATVADALTTLGRLQLQSGRRIHTVRGGPGATVADVAALLVGAADIFEHVILAGRGQRPFALRRSR